MATARTPSDGYWAHMGGGGHTLGNVTGPSSSSSAPPPPLAGYRWEDDSAHASAHGFEPLTPPRPRATAQPAPSAPSGPSLAQQLAGYASIAQANAPMLIAPAKRYARDFAVSYPLTSFHITAGTSLFLVSSVGLFPGPQTALFHPSYALLPRLQLYRVPVSFLTLGTSLFEVIRRGWMFFDYGSKLEAKTGSSADGFLNWAELTPEQRLAEVAEWARTNTYLHLQLVSAATIMATEFALNLVWPGTSSADAALASIPPHLRAAYTPPPDPSSFHALSPQLELSTLFLWAFLEPSSTRINVLGVFPVQPIYFPIAMSLTSGVQAWAHMVKGFVAAATAAYVMGLKRPDSGEDVITWVWHEALAWKRWAVDGERARPEARRGGRVVRPVDQGAGQGQGQTLGAAPGQANDGGRGGYLGSSAAAVTQRPGAAVSAAPAADASGDDAEGSSAPVGTGSGSGSVGDWFSSMLPPARSERRGGQGQGRRLGDA